MAKAQNPRHVIGEDGHVYQMIPVPDISKRPGIIARIGGAIMLCVKVMGWISISLITIGFLGAKRK